MGIEELIETARETATVKRVFGEPYEHNGITIVPAAKIGGGAGSGEADIKGHGNGGSGMGVGGKPAGAFVVEGNMVTWKPAIDVNRIILGAQVVAVVALLTLRTIVKARQKTRTVMALRGCMTD
jgi:uncharacterized spore protein YtfJ